MTYAEDHDSRPQFRSNIYLWRIYFESIKEVENERNSDSDFWATLSVTIEYVGSITGSGDRWKLLESSGWKRIYGWRNHVTVEKIYIYLEGLIFCPSEFTLIMVYS